MRQFYICNEYFLNCLKSNTINILSNPNNMISYLDINIFNNILFKLFNKKHKNFILNIGSDKEFSIINPPNNFKILKKN